MPTIIAIEKQKRRPRADVYLEGALIVTLRLDVIAIAKLEVGADLPHDRRKELEAEDQRLTAVESALRLLAIMPRSEKDLRQRLKIRGLRSEAVDAAIIRMRELGYLDDTAFARFFVDARQASTPRSRRALQFELSRKGVDRSIASEAVAELSDADAAYDAAQRRMRALRNHDRQTFTRRLGNFLASRGFSYGVSRSAIDRCWSEVSADSQVGELSDF